MNVSPENINPELEQYHRDAMLNLVLAWGSLDGAIKMLLSDLKGYTLEEGADALAKLQVWKALKEIRDIYRGRNGSILVGNDIARSWEKVKKKYEKYSIPRNIIAHSRCIGSLHDNPNYILFLSFERYADHMLTCHCLPIEQMHDATRWGEKLEEGIHNLPVLPVPNTTNS